MNDEVLLEAMHRLIRARQPSVSQMNVVLRVLVAEHLLNLMDLPDSQSFGSEVLTFVEGVREVLELYDRLGSWENPTTH